MVKAYMESGRHAQLVAIFDDEDTYTACKPILEKLAKDANMFVTESVECEDIENLDTN